MRTAGDIQCARRLNFKENSSDEMARMKVLNLTPNAATLVGDTEKSSLPTSLLD
jgi:hypothetical protein